MELRQALTPSNIAIGLEAHDKNSVIEALIDLMVSSGTVTDREAARTAVYAREKKMSTGMKNSIAIPHGKTDTVKDLAACIAVTARPIPFDSLDGEPCQIFIMTLSPADKTGPHLQFLAEISQLFKSKERRDAILAAKTKDELISIIFS